MLMVLHRPARRAECASLFPSPGVVLGESWTIDMESSTTNHEPSTAGAGQFTTTHWSVVLEAGQDNSPKGSEAMALLCRTYWYPLYAYVRRKGYDAPDAQD